MLSPHPRSTARIAGHPIHPMLIPFPIVCFIGAFVTDLVFLSEGDPVWARASWWLLLAGLVTAALAALAGLTDFAGDRRRRGLGVAWAHMIGNVTAVVIELVNLLLRTDDPASPVSGAGVILSGITVLILAVTGWLGGELVFRHGVGVDDKVGRHEDMAAGQSTPR
jgi:uncharacterized membrane protein